MRPTGGAEGHTAALRPDPEPELVQQVHVGGPVMGHGQSDMNFIFTSAQMCVYEFLGGEPQCTGLCCEHACGTSASGVEGQSPEPHP